MRPPTDTQVDLVVVGAGFAGLAAAEKLAPTGRRILILEARDRVGGRAFSRVVDGHVVELGAEFVHGVAPEIFSRVEHHGLHIDERFGEHWCTSADGPVPCVFSRGADALLSSMREYDGPDLTFAEYLNRKRPLDPESEEWAIGYIEGFNAARKEHISVRSLIQGDEAADAVGGDRLFVVREGYSALAEAMRRALPSNVELCLGTPVRNIEWSPHRVIVDAGRKWTARAVLVTIPVSLMTKENKLFSPPLPAKWEAASNIAMGSAVRVTLVCKEAVWRPKMPDLLMLHTRRPPFPIWWTMHPNDAPVLTGWAAGSKAERLGDDAVLEAVEAATAALLQPLDVTSANMHDWRTDPLSRGAYSYAKAGHVDALEQLAEPVEGTLFFAGEATNSLGRNGTVDGAIASGERAAAEMIAQAD